MKLGIMGTMLANLKNQRHPKTKFRRNPPAYLTRGFLERAGLVDLKPQESLRPMGGRPETHPSLRLAINGHLQEGSSLMKTSLAAWRTVLTMLEMQVPRPAFDRWVSGAELVHYDPENCVFTVAVQDEDQLNWLQDRLASTIRRLLLGVCNRPADVQFVILPSRE